MTVINHVLPLAHHAQPLVVDDHNLHTNAVAVAGAQFMDRHIQAAIAVNVDHEAFRMSDLGADRRRQAISHGAETGAGQEGAGAGSAVMLHGPHLVLAHAHADDGFAVCHIAEQSDGLLRADPLLFRHRVREVCLQSPAVFTPFTMPPGLHCDQLRKRRPDLGTDRQDNGLVLVQLGSVNVDMDDLAVPDELADHAGYTVIESHPQCEHQVRLVYRDVGVPGSVHAEHVQAQRMPGREGAQAHDRGGYRHTKPFGKGE